MVAAPAVQIEFDSPAKEYVPWLQGIGPGCDYIIERLRVGDTLAFAEVIQQYLFDNPTLGERLHDEVEEGLVDGTLLDECDLPPEALEYVENFWNQPTVFIKFMDTMKEAGVDYSHGAVLRAEDLADYSQEIEEIAMTLKSVDEKLEKLLDAVNGRHGLMERMAVVETKQDAAKEEAQKSEDRLVKAISAAATAINEKLGTIPDRNEVGNIINDKAMETRRFRIAQWIAFGLIVVTLVVGLLDFFKH